MFRNKKTINRSNFQEQEFTILMQSCCGQGAMIQSDPKREAMKKRASALCKLKSEYLNISLFFLLLILILYFAIGMLKVLI